jgi:hypothetical protein
MPATIVSRRCRRDLVQLTRHAGIRVIGIAGPGQQDRVRELGAVPLDYRGKDVPAPRPRA